MATVLVRPTSDRMIAGVAAGVADRFGWSRTAVRAALVISIALPGPQVLAYLAAWVLIPDEAKVLGTHATRSVTAPPT